MYYPIKLVSNGNCGSLFIVFYLSYYLLFQAIKLLILPIRCKLLSINFNGVVANNKIILYIDVMGSQSLFLRIYY